MTELDVRVLAVAGRYFKRNLRFLDILEEELHADRADIQDSVVDGRVFRTECRFVSCVYLGGELS